MIFYGCLNRFTLGNIHLPLWGHNWDSNAGKILHFRKNPPPSALCELNDPKNELILQSFIVSRWGYDFCVKKNKGLSVKGKSAEIVCAKPVAPVPNFFWYEEAGSEGFGVLVSASFCLADRRRVMKADKAWPTGRANSESTSQITGSDNR
jgi:hypothetical protein